MRSDTVRRMRWLVVGLAAASAAIAVPFVASGAGGTPTFGPAKTVATQSGVGALTEIETGDLNGDRRDDLVVTRIAFPIAHQTFPIGIYLADGKGGFVDGSSMWNGPPPRTEHGRQIVIADFNGDHRNDIFVADHGYDGPPFPGHRNSLALSTSTGTLVDASANMPPESGFSHSAAAADVNRDGSVDLFVGNLCTFCTDAPPEILLNDGTGHFTRRTDLLPTDMVADTDDMHRYTRSLFVDANGDGAPDLVLGADDHTPTSRVLVNDGTGRFRDAAAPLPPKPLGPTSILISLATLDIDRDGRPDLLAGFTPGNPFYAGSRIQLLIGNGDGTFRDETAQRLPDQDAGVGWPYAVRVADVNGDGHLDFGVSVNGAYTERAPIYLADDRGVYHPVPIRSSQPWLAFADPNSDGRTDIISATGGDTERIDVQLQLVLPSAPGGIRTTAVRDGIRISWRPVPNADHYEIWRSTPGRLRRMIGTTQTPRFDDHTARRGVRYVYLARAVTEAGKSAFSTPATGRRA
jgi:hypothetical protein